ncbi:hypothetical protein ACFL6B_02130 [Thermodesulfobacteriota bacterium]
MKNEDKRKRFRIVHKFYETRILIFVISYMVILILFMAVFIFIPNFIQLTDPRLPLEVQAAAAEKILEGHSGMWPALIALVVLVGIHFYQVFHRFIGPLYRFSAVFRQVAEGDLSFPVHLRKIDYLQEEKDEINRMLEVLSGRIGKAQQEINRALSLINYMEQTGAACGGQETSMIDRLIELRDLHERLNETLSFFQIKKESEA